MAAALEAQNAALAPSPARDAHLEALRSGATAVVTGQQTGLFLGPLYTIYKAASAIRLARSLAERWGAPVVPIFWLQTEDHDAAEIAVCHVARGSDDPLTLSIEVEDNGVSVSHRVLPAAVDELLAQVDEELARLPHGDEHLACLRRHYRPGASWSRAFAGVLAELFAEEGLVFVDPRDPALAELGAPVHRKALIEAQPLARALSERVRALEAAGWSAPVYVREDAPLSFYHPDGPEGARHRLVGTHAHPLEELLGVLDKHPDRFSTSALLRPILQDTWLPTVAYVGGPGELAYLAQLPPLYAAFELPMPIVVPRVSLRLVDAATRRILTRRALTTADVCRPIEAVLARAGDASGELMAKRVTDEVDRVLDAVAPRVREAGGNATRSLEKTRRSIARAVAKLGRNYDRALLLRDRELVDDVRRAQARLFARNVPQERFFGLASFAARYGQRTVIERVLAAAEPLRTQIGDIDL